jgi:hypothetical protein
MDIFDGLKSVWSASFTKMRYCSNKSDRSNSANSNAVDMRIADQYHFQDLFCIQRCWVVCGPALPRGPEVYKCQRRLEAGKALPSNE